jgi:hypothetical protein
MLDLIVSIIIILYAISLFIAPVMLFLIRLQIVIKNKSDFKKTVMILFIPGSAGLYLNHPDDHRVLKLYESLVVLFFILTVLGSIYVIYTFIG